MSCQKPDIDCPSRDKASTLCYTSGHKVEPGKVYVVECPYFKKKEAQKP